MPMLFWGLLILILGIVGFFVGKLLKHKSLYPFMPFRHDFRKRRDSFRKTLTLLDSIKAKTIVETGTSREGLHGAKSNGAATIVFGKWAKNNGAILHSVDISEKSIENSQMEVDKQGLSSVVHLHLSDSLEFLKKFDRAIDFLYLDSFDYSDDIAIQKQSQEHHLKEFQLVEDKLHKKSIVLIDDCDLPNGGKGKLAIEYMEGKGWKKYMDAYQVLLVREDFPF